MKRKMNAKVIFVLSFMLCGGGCVTRVGPDVLGTAVRRHTDVGLNHVYYMGSRGEDHFLLHQHAQGSRVYRISGHELIIEPTFAYTRDEEAWRLLAERWWPSSPEGAPLVFREAAPLTERDEKTVRMNSLRDGEPQ